MLWPRPGCSGQACQKTSALVAGLLRKLKAENEATEGNSKSPIEVMESGSRRLDA